MAWTILLLSVIGCSHPSDERLVEMAREMTARQSERNRQMAQMQQAVAEGSKHLIEADAKARAELTTLQQDLRADQAEVGRQRDALEAERRELAERRARDPIVAEAICLVGATLACLLPLALAGYIHLQPSPAPPHATPCRQTMLFPTDTS